MQILPRRALHGAIWAYTLVHLVVAALLPLAAHETHYALYARSLQLSYLDHPPLAPWLQSLVLGFSSSDFALRLLPIGLSMVAMYLLARLTRVVCPEGSAWTPLIAVLILQGTLVFHGGMTLSPDVPLLPLALGVVLAAVRVTEGWAWRDWLLLGVLLGLAGLAKYTAVTLAISVVWLVVARRGWRGLFSGGLWLAGGTAVLLVSPVLWWNWQHDWITVTFHSEYQFRDIERWSVVEFLRSMAVQVLYFTPLLVAGGLAVLLAPGRGRRGDLLAGRQGVLVIFAVPVLALYLLTALESRASPHWSILGWLYLIPLLADRLQAGWRASRSWRVLTWFSGAYSAVILAALLLFSLPLGKWPDFKHPARLLMGWEAAARHGDRLRRSLPARGFPGEPAILARNWHHVGFLAWYLPEVRVMNLFRDLNPHNQKTGYPDHRTWGMLVYPRYSWQPRLKDLTRDFDCEPIDSQPALFGRSLARVFHFYACYSRLPAAGSGS